MRLIRRLVVLAIIGGGGVAAYNYWSDHGWPLRSRAATLDTADVKRRPSRSRPAPRRRRVLRRARSASR